GAEVGDLREIRQKVDELGTLVGEIIGLNGPSLAEVELGDEPCQQGFPNPPARRAHDVERAPAVARVTLAAVDAVLHQCIIERQNRHAATLLPGSGPERGGRCCRACNVASGGTPIGAKRSLRRGTVRTLLLRASLPYGACRSRPPPSRR